ncbi:MAG: DUF488 family protein [Oleiphilaceae bacterium]|nr:DUF488 family protein [Oleiphilaceae bacterium]
MTRVNVKRVYDEKEKDDGLRVLVDRVWPRGLSKERAAVDYWFRDLAPSSALRQWFGHDPHRWPDFLVRYLDELKREEPEDLDKLKACLEEHDKVTLLFGAKETKYNNAVALAEFVEKGSV